MGLRETLNENPAITTGVTAGIIILALVVIVYQLWPDSQPGMSDQTWYTNDDGKTWYKDSVSLIPPVQKDGKESVRAYVYKCGRGKPFVAYMERWTADGKKRLEAAKAQNQMDPGLMQELAMEYREVKKPGEAKWVNVGNFQESGKVTGITCPDGTTKDLEAVYP